jgi:hypothetical protein
MQVITWNTSGHIVEFTHERTKNISSLQFEQQLHPEGHVVCHIIVVMLGAFTPTQ